MPNVFAAAGVAAALAASLTAFAAPIDGAVAAPPLTVNVVVDNPANDQERRQPWTHRLSKLIPAHRPV